MNLIYHSSLLNKSVNYQLSYIISTSSILDVSFFPPILLKLYFVHPFPSKVFINLFFSGYQINSCLRQLRLNKCLKKFVLAKNIFKEIVNFSGEIKGKDKICGWDHWRKNQQMICGCVLYKCFGSNLLPFVTSGSNGSNSGSSYTHKEPAFLKIYIFHHCRHFLHTLYR